MHKRNPGFSLIAILALTFSLFLLFQCTVDEPKKEKNATSSSSPQRETPELAEYMSNLQYFTHKLALSIDAEYQELALFYFHEVRASIDKTKEDIPGYEGYDIAQLMTILFDPTIQPLDQSLKNGNWEEARKHMLEMIDACNTCHRASSHGFVNVTAGFDRNPYNQSFEEPAR
ncbi:MAG: hypothetical protein R3211_06330 [Balneolaceae bacterium]|nr:hypothetical protein [Balneolaceae bacterium]